MNEQNSHETGVSSGLRLRRSARGVGPWLLDAKEGGRPEARDCPGEVVKNLKSGGRSACPLAVFCRRLPARSEDTDAGDTSVWAALGSGRGQ
jgi:hypothetical protein